MWRVTRGNYQPVRPAVCNNSSMSAPNRIRYRAPLLPGVLTRTAAATMLLATFTLTTATSRLGDLPLDDEFRTDPIFNYEETAPSGAVWSDGKVSLAGLMSMQWARQELHLTMLEYFGLAMLVGYAVVYIVGRRRNYRIAREFITGVHDGLFYSRFLEAGPASEIPPADRRQLLARDSCNTFLYYATGSRRCSGVLVRIELANRHDLFMLLWGLFNPTSARTTDRVTVEVAFGEDDIEPMIFAVAPKKDAKKLLRDVPHLQDYTTVTKGPSSLPPLGLVCLSESSALVDPLLQPAVKVLSEHAGLLELLHVTDQNDEPILGQEETPRKALRFSFRLPDGDKVGPTKMMALALDFIDTLTNLRMSAATKKKACDKREAVQKRKSKLTHLQRQERYQQLKNERLQREREEYESLTPEQKRRRDLKEEKKARKSARGKHKMKLART